MLAKDIMNTRLIIVHNDASIAEAARIMKENNIGWLPVQEDHSIVGVVSDRDIVIRVISNKLDPKTTTVKEIASSTIVFCNETDDVKLIAEIMKEHQVRRLLVIDSDRNPVGVVSISDMALETEKERELTGEVLAGMVE